MRVMSGWMTLGRKGWPKITAVPDAALRDIFAA
jgi:hypothetical protein